MDAGDTRIGGGARLLRTQVVTMLETILGHSAMTWGSSGFKRQLSSCCRFAPCSGVGRQYSVVTRSFSLWRANSGAAVRFVAFPARRRSQPLRPAGWRSRRSAPTSHRLMARPRPAQEKSEDRRREPARAVRDSLEQTYEAGIALTGTEVKSLRFSEGSIAEGLCRVNDGGVWLVDRTFPVQPRQPVQPRAERPRKLVPCRALAFSCCMVTVSSFTSSLRDTLVRSESFIVVDLIHWPAILSSG